jgi:2-amino-4-hydroxy-6-hydroxymethyldihydropteridine diphosphokinase
VHPIIERAARGDLPDWAQAKPKRRAHMARVAALIGAWADVIAPEDGARWRAAAWLHDALRDASVDSLSAGIGDEFRGWPPALLHGPASASRLRAEGVADEPLLNAVAYHTVGHPSLDRIGQALYMADFLEPGRTYTPVWRALMRARMPDHFDDVVRAVAGARIQHLLQRGAPIRRETSEFWNRLVKR